MKITALLLLCAFVTASATGYSQQVTLSAKDAPLEKILQSIKKQTGYSFLYTASQLKAAKKVTIEVNNANLEEVLDKCFAGQPFTYSIIEKTIVVKNVTHPNPSQGGDITISNLPPLITVKGRIVNESGEGVAASIIVKGTAQQGATSNGDGYFELTNVNEQATLQITGISIQAIEIKVNGRSNLGDIRVRAKVESLNEVVIKRGYWEQKKETMLGNVVRIEAKEIRDQPVVNILQALQGRTPGVEIVSLSGVPGTWNTITIRGKSTVRTDAVPPLFVVDGVPVASNPTTSNARLTLNGIDPLNTINPENIESIEILKDADATAIYGSRGAYGVVLITTKKGAKNLKGKTQLDVSFYKGIGKAPKMDLMNREQYLAMRREAFANDGLIPTANPADNGTNGKRYAPDLMVWDTTRSTDWQKQLFGGTAQITNAEIALSGGNGFTSFRFSGGYHHSTIVFPGDFGYSKVTSNLSVQHQSSNNKFTATFTASFGADNNKLFDGNLVPLGIHLAPVAPSLYNSDGSLNWAIYNNNATWTNPLAQTRIDHRNKTKSLIANSVLQYELLKGLRLRANVGYTSLSNTEVVSTPYSSFNPRVSGVINSTQVGKNDFSSWIIEPQASYNKRMGDGSLDLLIGITYQESGGEELRVTGYSYASDDLLGDLSSASYVNRDLSNKNNYKYAAVFGRAAYNWKKKYLINLTGRRDGSSRFGPGKQFGNFGALGLGWIFTNEKFFNKFSFINFGKIRGSYGITGSDNIPDYGFLSTFTPTTYTYDGLTGLYPTALANPDYSWETNKKLEIGVELGLLQDRINFSASWYRNLASDQLVGYQLPRITGFTSVPANLPATVENTGLELILNTVNLRKNEFTWSSAFNITIPRNKLISFPNLEGSTYRNSYIIGQPLNIYKAYKGLGVNPQTGIYQTADLNGDGKLDIADQQQVIDVGRKFYGGINNTLSYKTFELSFLFEFVKQVAGTNPATFPGPGSANANQPAYILSNVWRKSGDLTTLQKISTGPPAISQEYGYWLQSNLNFSDASFLRLKTLAVSYNLPAKLVSRWHMEFVRVYIHGQNLITFTDYIGLDPQVPNRENMPVLKMLTAGIQIKL